MPCLLGDVLSSNAVTIRKKIVRLEVNSVSLIYHLDFGSHQSYQILHSSQSRLDSPFPIQAKAFQTMKPIGHPSVIVIIDWKGPCGRFDCFLQSVQIPHQRIDRCYLPLIVVSIDQEVLEKTVEFLKLKFRSITALESDLGSAVYDLVLA